MVHIEQARQDIQERYNAMNRLFPTDMYSAGNVLAKDCIILGVGVPITKGRDGLNYNTSFCLQSFVENKLKYFSYKLDTSITL